MRRVFCVCLIGVYTIVTHSAFANENFKKQFADCLCVIEKATPDNDGLDEINDSLTLCKNSAGNDDRRLERVDSLEFRVGLASTISKICNNEEVSKSDVLNLLYCPDTTIICGIGDKHAFLRNHRLI
jgi:hypothetical protein